MADIETLRARAGLDPADNTRDTELTAAWATAVAVAENYLDRKFTEQEETETFTQVRGYVLSLSRYPLTSVTSLVADGKDRTGQGYLKETLTGLLRFGYYQAHDEITVTYTGGYATLPADLDLAVLSIFDNTWQLQTGGGDQSLANAVKQINITGVGSMSFDNSQDATGFAAGVIPPGALALLEYYKRHWA